MSSEKISSCFNEFGSDRLVISPVTLGSTCQVRVGWGPQGNRIWASSHVRNGTDPIPLPAFVKAMSQPSFYKCISFSDGDKPSGAASPALPAAQVAVAFAATHLLLQPGSNTLLLTRAPGKCCCCLYISISGKKKPVVLLGTKPKLINRSPLVPSDGDGVALAFCSTECGLVCERAWKSHP